ncbi:hypothetical protein LL972_21195 [Xanthomonas campestris pv. asclepiadis]|uniref:hypothetical protein n=1 Tax=Xanthomonas campestris TaxID=339 RepID=UPI001E53B475|nr:hypothetical protein [Xanthomonas campestris]MCC4618468.1 hypothetical protein [Xanthomonas campestris pv. asclepiadis]
MRIRLNASTSHWRDGVPVQHGPQTWPWWRLLGLSLLRLDMHRPSTGYRLWFYTRWGALYGDVVFDRRKQAAA